MFKINQPTVFITCGIPCSGKSTWIKNTLTPAGFKSISRDDIRLEMYKCKYSDIPFTPQSEHMITNVFDNRVTTAITKREDIVLDNTHCRSSYLKEAIYRFAGTDYKIYVVFFDIPIWKAYLRNIIRYIKEGKWIPKDVMKAMYKNYNKINQKDYDNYKW